MVGERTPQKQQKTENFALASLKHVKKQRNKIETSINLGGKP